MELVRVTTDGGSGEMPLMIDRFVIEDELGAGGMGRVYLAYDPRLERKVAIKVLRDRLGVDVERAHERMAREARAMARLRHPHVVTVHEVGTDECGVYIVMEYVAGKTLRGWLEREPEPSWRDIIANYLRAGRGLLAAHEAGLVHRDFKPDNVLVGDDGRVVVGDFGIANLYGTDPTLDPSPSADPTPSRLTRTGVAVGTPPYMSPEQHAGGAVDARTDQFAFCAALYEALYGVRPFAGETSGEIAGHARDNLLTPPAHDRNVPSRVRAAILRGLRGEPDERFASMAPLLDQLARGSRSNRRRAATIAAPIAVAAAAALWIGTHAREHPPATAAAPPSRPIAVEPIDVALSYGDRVEWRKSIGDVVALLLGDVDGFKAIGPATLLAGEHPDLRAAEIALAASYVVSGSIEQRADRIYARILVSSPGGPPHTIEADRPAVELARLLDDVTDDIAEAIAPGHRLDHDHAMIRARTLYALGDEHFRNDRFQLASPFLEQAVTAAPTFFEAWYTLALTRSWVLAPETLVFAAIDAARAAAPNEVSRRLVDGLSRYLHHDLPGARTILEPLTTEPGLTTTERRDALYLLGEAHWHDGHNRIGVDYFRRALDMDMTFKLPVEHLGEYAMANRDVATMQKYSLMIASSASEYQDVGQLMLGHYEAIARTGAPPTRLYATLLLGRPVTPELESELGGDVIVRRVLHVATAAEAGDATTARAELDEIWRLVRSRESSTGELPDNVYFMLRLLGDVELCGGMTGDVRQLVEFLAARSHDHPVRSYARLSILAAPLVADRTWIVRRELSDRDRVLADAIDAEMTGNRERAVELLVQLVHDPSPMWDYPERVALLRNLRALHRGSEARALCDDTLHPAIFELAYLPTRKACTNP